MNKMIAREKPIDRLTASSPSVDGEALNGMQQPEPAANDNMDRQHPEGSGGKPI
jgi:hypothetical protein